MILAEFCGLICPAAATIRSVPDSPRTWQAHAAGRMGCPSRTRRARRDWTALRRRWALSSFFPRRLPPWIHARRAPARGDECTFLIFLRARVGVRCGGVGVVAHSSAVSLFFFFYCSLCSSIPKRIHAYQRDRRRYACIRCGTGNRLQPVCCVLSVAEFDRPGLGIHRFHDGQ